MNALLKKLLTFAPFAFIAAWSAFQSAPELTGLDAGELGSAAFELGIAHPPGYPLFAMFHKAASLIPLGQIAQRMNFASAFAGFLSLALAFRLCQVLKINFFISACSLILLSQTPLWTLHSASIEVYSGTLAFVASFLILLHRLFEGDRRYAFGIAFLSGLCLGHHAEIRLFAAVSCAIALFRLKPRQWIPFLLMGIAGGLVTLYLPLRSAQDLMRDWGHPASFQGFYEHLAGKRILSAYASQLGLRWNNIATFAQQIFHQNEALALFGLGGCLVFALQKNRRFGFVLLAFAAIDAIYSSAINPMGLRDYQNGLPLLFCLALGLALLGQQVFERFQTKRWPVLLAAVCFLPLTWSAQPRFTAHLPQVLDAISAEAPGEAALLVTSDHLASAFAFAQTAEHARPDLAVLVRQHDWDSSSYGPVQRRLPEPLRGWNPKLGLRSLRCLNARWPLLWEWSDGSDAALRPALDWNQPLPSKNVPPNGEDALQFFYKDEVDEMTESDPLADLLDGQARSAISRHQDALAFQKMKLALERDPAHALRWINAASAASGAGQLKLARQLNAQALEMEPQNPVALHNSARYALLDRDDEAFFQALAQLPEDAELLELQGFYFAERGDYPKAKDLFLRALERDPNRPDTKTALQKLEALP